jgi:hypothetical protein
VYYTVAGDEKCLEEISFFGATEGDEEESGVSPEYSAGGERVGEGFAVL